MNLLNESKSAKIKKTLKFRLQNRINKNCFYDTSKYVKFTFKTYNLIKYYFINSTKNKFFLFKLFEFHKIKKYKFYFSENLN